MAGGLLYQQLHLSVHVQSLLVGKVIACVVQDRQENNQAQGGHSLYYYSFQCSW